MKIHLPENYNQMPNVSLILDFSSPTVKTYTVSLEITTKHHSMIKSF